MKLFELLTNLNIYVILLLMFYLILPFEFMLFLLSYNKNFSISKNILKQLFFIESEILSLF